MKKAIVLGAIGTILFNIFFFTDELGVGLAGILTLFNFYFFLTKNPKSKNLTYAYTASSLSILFSFLVGFRASDIVETLNFIAALFFALIALTFYKQEESFSLSIPSFLLTPFLTLKQSVSSILAYAHKDTWEGRTIKKDIVYAILRGVGITIPLVLVLFYLLKSADPVFAKLSQDLFNSIGARTVFSLSVFAILVTLGVAKIKQLTKKESVISVSSAKIFELSTITGSIILLFTAFIVIQFQYLFSSVGERELHKIGVMSLTYSEYIRKGFIELLFASTIASSVIIYTLRSLHFLQEKHKRIMQVLAGILTIETAILLLSDAQRIFLYAEAHGLTRARIYGLIFLIWLACLLMIFLISVIKKQKSKNFFGQVLAISLLALFSINIINIDSMMASQYKPTVNSEVDYYYLSTLSSDASTSWKPAIEDIEKTVAQLTTIKNFSEEDMRKLYWARATITRLDKKISYLLSKYGTLDEYNRWTNRKDDRFPQHIQSARGWQGFNAGEYNAYRLIKDNLGFFKKIHGMQKKINAVWEVESIKQPFTVPLDRSMQAPLTL